jgi:hypothetical protein
MRRASSTGRQPSGCGRPEYRLARLPSPSDGQHRHLDNGALLTMRCAGTWAWRVTELEGPFLRWERLFESMLHGEDVETDTCAVAGFNRAAPEPLSIVLTPRHQAFLIFAATVQTLDQHSRFWIGREWIIKVWRGIGHVSPPNQRAIAQSIYCLGPVRIGPSPYLFVPGSPESRCILLDKAGLFCCGLRPGRGAAGLRQTRRRSISVLFLLAPFV